MHFLLLFVALLSTAVAFRPALKPVTPFLSKEKSKTQKHEYLLLTPAVVAVTTATPALAAGADAIPSAFAAYGHYLVSC